MKALFLSHFPTFSFFLFNLSYVTVEVQKRGRSTVLHFSLIRFFSVAEQGQAVLDPRHRGGPGRAQLQRLHDGRQAQDGLEAVQLPHGNVLGGGARGNHEGGNSKVRREQTKYVSLRLCLKYCFL